MKPRLLDLFCGVGGAAMGYYRAGFDVVGVDVVHQPRYPFEFRQDDALGVLDHMADWPIYLGRVFDAIHASPPCQRWAGSQNITDDAERHPDLITPLRPLLDATGLPYVIENVPRAPLRDPVMICGSMFDPPLGVKLHRHFETNWPLEAPVWPCRHRLWAPIFPPRASKGNRRVVSPFGRDSNAPLVRQEMGMPWATRDEISQAIPPAYTEHVGDYLMAHLNAMASEAA